MAENQCIRQWSCAIHLTDGTWHYKCIYCKTFVEGEKKLREHVSSFHQIKDQTEGSEKGDVVPEAEVNEGETKTEVTQANYESFAEMLEETERSDRVYDCRSLPEVEATNFDFDKSEKPRDKLDPDPSSSKENTPTRQTQLKLDYNAKRTHPTEKNEFVDAVAVNGKHMPTAPEVTHRERNRLYDCKTCKKSFSQSSSLKIHERTHSGERPYICKFCNKSFSRMEYLKIHDRTHTGEKPYICQTCNKSFTSHAGLFYHKTAHNREKLHICRFCEKGFDRNWTLKRHERIHTGERPHECNVCGKKFRDRRTLVRHFGKCDERSEAKNYS